MGDRLVVISTERDARTEYVDRCLMSVAGQTERHMHVFVSDGSERWKTHERSVRILDESGVNFQKIVRHPREANRCALQNVYEEIHKLEDSVIVCWVDGDDWLAHPKALERVRAEYDRTDKEVWLTWGQFEYNGGQPGWASDYSAGITATGSFRHDIWRATHLKTFRAGLFKRIRKQKPRGRAGDPKEEWVKHAIDLAVMFPMLEMAREHGSFIPDVLYTYSGENGGSSGPGSPTWAEAERIRGLTPYSRLEARPW